MSDPFVIAGVELGSRLILGTGGAPSLQVVDEVLAASGHGAVHGRDAPRRRRRTSGSILDVIDRRGVRVLPNTAGCRTAREAVRTAQLAREALETDWVKLEVVADERTLLPDPIELLDAAQALVARRLPGAPYTNDDPVLARRLQQAGCVAVMPLGSPIGTGPGHRQPAQHRADRRRGERAGRSSTPASAPPRTPRWRWSSAATRCCSPRPSPGPRTRPRWPRPWRSRCEAGRLARRAGRIPKRFHAQASSPTEGMAVL